MYISIYIYIYIYILYIKRVNRKSYSNFTTVVLVYLTFTILLALFFSFFFFLFSFLFFFLWMHKVVVYLLYYFWFVHNNFHNTFITNQIWKIVIDSNLNLPIKLLFYSPITTCSNLLLMICCENVMDITFFVWKMLRHLDIVTIFSKLLSCQFFTS